MSGAIVRVGEAPLSCGDVDAVARDRASVEIAESAERAMASSAAGFAAAVARGESIYGMTCGVGGLEHVAGGREQRSARQRNLLRSHAAGVGPAMADDQVRAMMLVRLCNLAAGRSGIDPRLPAAIAALLNAGVTPIVPARGSVGAADLAPLAHAFLPLIGEGRARLRSGVEVGGREALARAGLEPMSLGGRDGLALIAGLAQTAGLGALVVADLDRAIRWSERAVALSTVAVGELATSLSPLSVSAKPHRGHAASAAAIRDVIGDRAGQVEGKLRSQMSSRVAAQVAGSARELAGDLAAVLEVEINAPADNPIIDDRGRICCNTSGFDGHRLAAAIDAATGAILSVAAGAERRVARLLDPARSGLPAYLIDPSAEPATSSGLMIAQYTAAAAVAEMNATWRPVAGLSIPTANGTEDLVSMAPIAARSAIRLTGLARIAIAVELLCAAEVVDLAGVSLSPGLSEVRAAVRERVCRRSIDRPPGPDIDALCELVRDGEP